MKQFGFLTDAARAVLRYGALRASDGLDFTPAQVDSTVAELNNLVTAGLLVHVQRIASSTPHFQPSADGYLDGIVAPPLENEALIFVRRNYGSEYITAFSRRLCREELPRFAACHPLDLEPGDWFLRSTIALYEPMPDAPQCIDWIEFDGTFARAHILQKTITGSVIADTHLWRIDGVASPVLKVCL